MFSLADYEDFFLVIHNIDGTMLRADRAQMVLSLLAEVRGFHIIASIDHINAPMSKLDLLLNGYIVVPSNKDTPSVKKICPY